MATVIAGEQPITELPGTTVPYVLRAGNSRAHLLISDVGRTLIGSEESNGQLSFMSCTGPAAPQPIPLHYHEQEHEFFYCFDGALQLWIDDESRILSPGDFGSIPPNSVHAYQILRHGTVFVGPIVPAGWDRFFDLLGKPFTGPAFALPPYEFPSPEQWGRAETEFSMKYVRDATYAEATFDAGDNELPGLAKPYFLKRGEGRSTLLGGLIETIICGRDETDGKVSMTTLTVGKGAGMPSHRHEQTHEVLMVLDGILSVTLDSVNYALNRGDLVSIPRGTEHAYRGEALQSRVLTSSTPAGIEGLVAAAGQQLPFPAFPSEHYDAISVSELQEVADSEGIDFKLCS